MSTKLPFYKQCIDEILNPNEPLVNSKLVYLSDISGEDIELWEKAWPRTNAERRQQIISQLVSLSEADFKLDFSSTFTFCLNDPDEAVRIQAIAGLELEENHLLITPLVRSLKEDNSTKVRAAAAAALVNLPC